MINAGVAIVEVPQFLFSDHDIARTKCANQVSNCCLDILMIKAQSILLSTLTSTLL